MPAALDQAPGEDRSSRVLDDQEYDGDIFKQLKCLEKIEQHIRMVTLPDGRGVPEDLVPTDCFLEDTVDCVLLDAR